MNQYRALCLMLLVGIAVPSAATKLYKSVDAEGNVTYSQIRPTDADSKQLEIQGVQGVSNEQAREQLDALSDRTQAVRGDREFKANYTSESKDRDDRMKANCETARQNVRVLGTASRIKGDDGSFIDESQREERLAKARKQVEDFCQ